MNKIKKYFCIKSKSSTLVRIKKRRGGNCQYKDSVFILILQVFSQKKIFTGLTKDKVFRKTEAFWHKKPGSSGLVAT